MSDERPDEFFSWRRRLSPPDALPEQGLDNRDLTWEKLAPRLQGQTSRRRLPVYHIAAACLLLLLIPVAFLFHNPRTHTTQPPNTNTTAFPQPGTLTAQPPAHLAPLTLRPAEASPILRSGPTPKELARLRPLTAQPTNHTHSQQTPAAKPQDSLPPPILTAGLVLDQVSPTPPQNTLKNNQLRIVHINELDNPNNPAPAMTSIRSREPDIRVLILLKNH
jgi:hypothetical protein